MNADEMLRFRLCYIDEQEAWFTTRNPLSEQWGDDWNDAPYEYNAGRPYEWTERDKCPPYELFMVMFRTDLETPAQIAGSNSHYSVEQINAGLTPWLCSTSWSMVKDVQIMAGITLPEFIDAIRQAGGEVFWPMGLQIAPGAE